MNPATPVVLPSSSSTTEPPFTGGLRGNNNSARRLKLPYLVLVLTFAVYLILGASLFTSIEAPAMEAIASSVDQLRGKFLARHPNVQGEWFVIRVGVELW